METSTNGAGAAAEAGGRAAPEGVPYPELVAQAKRRTFTAQHKAKIVAETEACTRPRDRGKPGASSAESRWPRPAP